MFFIYFSGFGMWKYSDGSVYEGEFREGIREG